LPRLKGVFAYLSAWLLAGAVASANTFVATDSFPGDTRTAVTMTGMPWRCIGRLSLPNHRFMTASLVGPDLILTAAHGLVRDGKLKPGDFIFRPDCGNPHRAAADSARVIRCWLGSDAPDQEPNVHADWAILQIDRKLGDSYGTLAVEDVEAAALAADHRPFCLVAYDRDFRAGRVASWQTGCEFVALNPTGYLLHDFSTDNGASGAPIFHPTNWSLTAAARIVALNVAEKTTQGETLYRVPFAPRVANVAVAAHEFYPTLQRLLAGDLSGGQAVP
jgi:V8-like Glu-specific endopeptidase